jgi:PAS domain S-box-containing protein
MKINSVALDLLGYEETDLLDKGYLSVMKATDMQGNPIEPFSRPIMRALQEGRPITDSLQYIKKDGTKFPAQLTVSPIMLSGKPMGTVEVFRDITREQQIDNAKTEFVSLASHQLRTPLTAIRWYLELFLNGKLGPITDKQRESLQELLNVNLNLIDLVRALLSVARIEVGTLAFVPKPSNIERLARDVVFELRPLIEEKQLKFSEKYDPKLPSMPLDRDLTHVIFQNLLTNAVKYTPPGGSVKLHIEQENDKFILIKVIDTGYGIPKNQQHQLFTKLFRADNVREKETDGTGLGLYIIQSIVESSGGEVSFESEENKGTTFFVRLPLKGMPSKEGVGS